MLYIVATPIGNLKEITIRALEALQSVDYILCEDTRTSAVLLNEYNIKKPLVAYHKFNEAQNMVKIIEHLQQGKEIALITDAGMPGISDPGNRLINALIENNLPYTVISGASAFINAFVLSGFSAPFTFVGFLPSKNSDRKELLKDLKDYKSALVFYESPHDIHHTLAELYAVFGDRKFFIARELTKKFESLYHGTLSNGYDGNTKGEFVLVVAGNDEASQSPLMALSVEEHLKFYLDLGYMKNDAIEIVAKERNLKKNEVYKIATKFTVSR